MNYRSTRSNETVTAEEALLKGLAADGGLYVPEQLPDPFLDADVLKAMSYEELAAFVLHHFLTDITLKDLSKLTHDAYTGTFDTSEIVPVKTLSESFSMAEMFHGRTCAFKDLALSLFPHLLVYAKKKLGDGKETLILTATSGDTGKAALEGFKDVPGVHIMVFYPSHGVSPLQKDQMQKQLGENVKVLGIEGNFDDAQSALKNIFVSDLRDEALEKGVLFSSANSINIGRLVPQVVYYLYSYLALVRRNTIAMGDAIDICVPTGNFGNILAAMYAREMGLPVGRFICASNKNHVLTDFISTGVYDRNRDFYKTTSPSMDILVASNIERYLHLVLKKDYKVREKMEALNATGRFDIPMDAINRSKLVGYWSTDAEGEARIKEVFDRFGYLMDPHTAVAYDGAKKHGSANHVLIMATASPYKFPETVADALGIQGEGDEDLLKKIQEAYGVEVPKPLTEVFDLPERFTESITVDEMKEVVKEGFHD